jgi:glycosyltransferase involved in cell wall biosynthesis
MRILLVHNSYQQHGGEDTVVRQEKHLLERSGHDVVLYHQSNDAILEYSSFERLTLPMRAVWSTDSRRRIESLIKQHRPEVVHVHNTFVVLSPSIYSACKENGIPVVQTLHNYRLICPAATFLRNGNVCEECIDHSLWRSVRYGCYHGRRSHSAMTALMLAVHRGRGTWKEEVTCYIALSEFARSKFLDAGFSADNIFVKPNFVYPDPGARGRQLPVFSCGYALFVGRLSPEKGAHVLLSAWQRLQTAIPLFIIGDGPERPKLEAEVARLGLSNVHFCGFRDRTETLAAMKAANFLVFPSTWYEPFGMTVVEALACGTPIICSRVGAIPEMVEDGRTGLHFSPGDSDDLAEKVRWAWSHPERLRLMRNEARNEFERKYTAEKNYPTLMRIYEYAVRELSKSKPIQHA